MPVAADRFVKRQSVLRLHDAADHRQIRAGDLLLGQSLIQLRLKERTLAEKHDPAGAFVQPVNRPDSAMLAGSQIIRRHRVGQRAGLPFIIRMDDHASRPDTAKISSSSYKILTGIAHGTKSDSSC